jgi:hypothetical protein
VWEEPFYTLRVPKLVDLQADPFERAPEEGIDYDHWRIDRIYMILPGVGYVADWLKSFAQFPPRQAPATFNLNDVMQKMKTASANANN